jgi:hypothetical protein
MSFCPHLFRVLGQTPENAYIGPDYPPLCAFGGALQGPLSLSVSSSSNVSLNCSGSLYGDARRSSTRLPIGQTSADGAHQRKLCSLHVLDAQCGTIAVTEIELGKIAVQVLLAAMLVNAFHAALEDAVEALNRIRVDRNARLAVRVAVFLPAMVNSVMLGELTAQLGVTFGLIRHHVAFAIQVGANDRQNVLFLDAIDVERAGRAAALNKRQNDMLVVRAALCFHAGLSANESFVDLYNRALAAHRSQAALAHGFTNAVSNKPSSFEIDAEHSTELIGAEALLATAKQVHGLKPDMHRHMAFLENGSDFDSEWLAAGIALVCAEPRALSLQRATFLDNATMRANSPVFPNDGFDVGVCGLLVAEAGLIKDGLGHCLSPWKGTYNA